MYEILKNPERMLIEEIREKFKGKWVYLLNYEIGSDGGILSATPMATGDRPFGSVGDGIYKVYDDYQIRC